jgi:hypothetical protein
MSYVREPSVSGAFYPDNPNTLKKSIEAYLQNVGPAFVEGEIIGIIAPHAGYMYSGQVAAYGYKALMGSSFDTVIIIAPSHRSSFGGVAVLEKGAYRTPLGTVPVDEEFTRELVALNNVFMPKADAHRGEHSLEVQIPFLQVILQGLTIVPLIMGSQEPAVSETLAECLSKTAKKTKKNILIVGSTDLSHYYPYAEAVELDTVVKEHLEAYDVHGLLDNLRKGTCEACGAGPMVSTMLASQKLGANGSKVLKYLNSGDVSGDRSGVVGYISCVFFKK